MEKMREKLLALLAECVEREVVEIRDEMEPVQDLELDSIRMLDFVLAIEDEFGIEFRDFSKMSQHMATVGEMLEFLGKVIEGGAE